MLRVKLLCEMSVGDGGAGTMVSVNEGHISQSMDR